MATAAFAMHVARTSDSSTGGLSPGAKAGIGVGVAVLIVALAAAGYLQRRARRRKADPSRDNVDDEKHAGAQETRLYETDGTKTAVGVPATESSNKATANQTSPIICEGGSCNKFRMVGA
ncbi:hypothetical protein EsH8_IV_000319 [Colletotrichum jinshuiense]